jgi:hypothetical protein
MKALDLSKKDMKTGGICDLPNGIARQAADAP